MPHPASRQLTQEDLPLSKVDHELSMLSVGISNDGDEDKKEEKSDDSNHEPMISASSNHRLTPSQRHNSCNNLEEGGSPPFGTLIIQNQQAPF